MQPNVLLPLTTNVLVLVGLTVSVFVFCPLPHVYVLAPEIVKVVELPSHIVLFFTATDKLGTGLITMGATVVPRHDKLGVLPETTNVELTTGLNENVLPVNAVCVPDPKKEAV
jgi:hypothetical protein